MVATAPPARTFLAVEMTGPWASNAIRESRASSPALVAAAGKVAAAGGRMVVIRRPDRRSSEGQRWFWADCRPGHETLRGGLSVDDDELVDLRLDGSDGEADPEPLWLCCTHGKHDRCCAEEGRVVFHDLEALRPGRVWESSHLGGCRFAGNVVVLPHGLYYGRVSTPDVPAIVGAHERGTLVRDHLRGRSALPPPAQAALHLVAERLDVRALDAVVVGEPTAQDDGGRWSVPVQVRGAAMVAVVRLFGRGRRVELTCSAQTSDRPPAWSLEALQAAPPPRV
jgi:hypothetical protein